MIVCLDDALFAAVDVKHLDLAQLFRLGRDGRHQILTDPLFEAGADRAVNRWVSAQNERLRDELLLALEGDPKAAVLGIPSRRTIRVADVAQASWVGAVPTLPLSDALALLELPLKLMMENRRFNRGLLLKAAPDHMAQALERFQERRWLEYDSGGGGGEAKKLVEQASIAEAWRTWVMIDSDARWGYQPSNDATQVREACEARLQAGCVHQLRRRTNENYVPLKALHGRAESRSGAAKKQARARFQAYADMSPEQRHHYNVREGFAQDRKSSPVPVGFGVHATRPELQEGLGDVKEVWMYGWRLPEEWFRHDGSTDELHAIVRSIFEAL